MCNVIQKILFGATLLTLVSAGGSAQTIFYASYDGIWEGKLKQIDASVYAPDFTFIKAVETEYQIAIMGSKVRVRFKKDHNTWNEVKPGAFRLFVHRTNAVVIATDSAGMPGSGQYHWVETWNFTMTRKDLNSVYAFFVRSVNNYMQPADQRDSEGDKSGRFFVSQFRRINSQIVEY